MRRSGIGLVGATLAAPPVDRTRWRWSTTGLLRGRSGSALGPGARRPGGQLAGRRPVFPTFDQRRRRSTDVAGHRRGRPCWWSRRSGRRVAAASTARPRRRWLGPPGLRGRAASAAAASTGRSADTPDCLTEPRASTGRGPLTRRSFDGLRPDAGPRRQLPRRPRTDPPACDRRGHRPSTWWCSTRRLRPDPGRHRLRRRRPTWWPPTPTSSAGRASRTVEPVAIPDGDLVAAGRSTWRPGPRRCPPPVERLDRRRCDPYARASATTGRRLRPPRGRPRAWSAPFAGRSTASAAWRRHLRRRRRRAGRERARAGRRRCARRLGLGRWSTPTGEVVGVAFADRPATGRRGLRPGHRRAASGARQRCPAPSVGDWPACDRRSAGRGDGAPEGPVVSDRGAPVGDGQVRAR